MSVTAADTIVASSEQISCSMGEQAVILHLQKGIYYGLNDVGQIIWDKLKSPTVVNELKQQIMAEYEVSEADCESDLMQVLDDLVTAGLVEVVRAPAT